MRVGNDFTAQSLQADFGKAGAPRDWINLERHLHSHGGMIAEAGGAKIALSIQPPALVIHQINRHRRISMELRNELEQYAQSHGLPILHWRSPIGNLELVQRYLAIGAHLMGNDGADFLWEIRIGG